MVDRGRRGGRPWIQYLGFPTMMCTEFLTDCMDATTSGCDRIRIGHPVGYWCVQHLG
jgi:hypothetical protein